MAYNSELAGDDLTQKFQTTNGEDSLMNKSQIKERRGRIALRRLFLEDAGKRSSASAGEEQCECESVKEKLQRSDMSDNPEALVHE